MMNIPDTVFNELGDRICTRYESCTDCPASTITGFAYGAFDRRCLFRLIRQEYGNNNNTHEENK